MRKGLLVLFAVIVLGGCIEWKAKGDTDGYIRGTPPTPEVVQPEKKEV